MKNLHNTSITQKQKSSCLSVKTDEAFKKSDFLTPGEVAKECEITVDIAKEVLKKLHFKRSIFIINGHKQPVVMRLGTNRLFVHPMAISEIKKYLDNQKG